FQPVIEKLEYVPPEIIGSAPYVIVEGISDYYALMLAKKMSDTTYSYSIMPGVGSGASGPLISQLMGQGQTFALLLDDDKEGKKAALRYKDEWFLDGITVSTLSDIDREFSGNSLGKLLGAEFHEWVQKSLELEKRPTKQQIGWYLAEACSTKQSNS